jgi:polyisoprenoid-binding protein YceI
MSDDATLARVVNGVIWPTSGAYTIDPVHTFVTFRTQHLVVGQVRGRFGVVSGIEIGKAPHELAVVVMVDSTSVTTLQVQRDEDLRSARFLDVITFPTITYRSSATRILPEGRWLVDGALTVHAITRTITLEATTSGAVVDSHGHARVAFHASANLTRRDFGLLADLDVESGGIEVTGDVSIDIDVEATKPLAT